MGVGRSFLEQSRQYLTAEYLPKIRTCLDRLTDEDIWWRPGEQANAIGNLVLHLAGNLRQWVVAGVGVASDTRDRASEFAHRARAPAAELLAVLEAAVHDADEVLAGLDPEQLSATRVIQGREVTILEAVYHAVEHFSMHTGQITYVTKLRTGSDLRLYRDAGGLALPQWKGARPVRGPGASS